MFVKHSWSTRNGKRYDQYHIAKSVWDPEKKQSRHKLILNITDLPDHVIKAIDKALKTGKSDIENLSDVEIDMGDNLRGAGLLAIHRAFKHEKMEKILGDLTPAQKKSVELMIIQRILNPSSKNALKEKLEDTLLARAFSKNRLDEDELYKVMDELHEAFYTVQERIQQENEGGAELYLYDITSSYFEGRMAEDGDYGHSRDKRWDRHQIVIGLVCNAEGLPLALEVWPGNTHDASTVIPQIKILKERFKIEKAVFIGDKGMYSETSINEILKSGFDYILGLNWQKQQKELKELAPKQLELFDEIGVINWSKDGKRFVGCVSQARAERARRRRELGMERVEEELKRLQQTSRSGHYYSWNRLSEKVNGILKDEGLAELYNIEITPIEEVDSPEEKSLFDLSFERDEEAIAQKSALEGKYVLETSLSENKYSAQKIDAYYKKLQQVERAFRNIKSYLKIRPIYHYLHRRVRAHVLICFLAYYLVKKMELELRKSGVEREVPSLLKDWDKLKVVEYTLKADSHEKSEWQWSLGEIGTRVQNEIKEVGWWRSINAYRASLSKSTG